MKTEHQTTYVLETEDIAEAIAYWISHNEEVTVSAKDVKLSGMPNNPFTAKVTTTETE